MDAKDELGHDGGREIAQYPGRQGVTDKGNSDVIVLASELFHVAGHVTLPTECAGAIGKHDAMPVNTVVSNARCGYRQNQTMD